MATKAPPPFPIDQVVIGVIIVATLGFVIVADIVQGYRKKNSNNGNNNE